MMVRIKLHHPGAEESALKEEDVGDDIDYGNDIDDGK